MTDMPHQIATRAIGGAVSVAIIRDPADGTARYAVVYQSSAWRWMSHHRFHEISHAESGCLTLADFLGAEVRS
jgi:hypothetical protein